MNLTYLIHRNLPKPNTNVNHWTKTKHSLVEPLLVIRDLAEQVFDNLDNDI